MGGLFLGFFYVKVLEFFFFVKVFCVVGDFELGKVMVDLKFVLFLDCDGVINVDCGYVDWVMDF